jgi:SAM-dependent methyltransferase
MTKSLGEENYEQFARRYAERAATKPHNAYYDRPNTLSLLPDVNGLSVLDAGCGPGIYAAWLVDHGARVVAFDVTPDFVDITRERVGERATVLRADLTQPLDFAVDASFDIVLCPLVLDYIEDWRPVFDEFYRVLKVGGVLVFSAGHPFGDWLYFPDTNYFDTALVSAEWGGFGQPRPLIKGYRRPLAAALNPLLDAGFRLDHLHEPLPTEEFRQADPADYEKLMRQPGFLCVRAVKEC